MANAVTPLITPSYDDSGQATEPSIVHFPNGWNGYQYWMVFAPYPHSNDGYENPSILVSDNGTEWSVPPGVTNPIERPGPGSRLADSSLFYDRMSRQLWLYYVSEDPTHYINLLRTVSSDGVRWTKPIQVLRVPEYQLVMPAVASDGQQYWLWAVDAGTIGCSALSTRVLYRTSVDGVHWSVARPVHLQQPGYRIWHISVATIPRFVFVEMGLLPGVHFESPSPDNPNWRSDWPNPWEDAATIRRFLPAPVFLMLASSFKDRCGKDSLFLAYSSDGISWVNFPKPLLTPAEYSWDSSGIYESTLAYDFKSDALRIWYSADGQAGWRIGLAQADFRSVIRDLIDNH